ncbi:MAG: YihY/virulence factor BrkB family protein [Solirubrobacteraceae bacterium]
MIGGDSGSLAAAAREGRPGPALEAADFKRAFERFQKDQVTDHAAALTYYALMSLFPALLFGVAVLGLFGQQGLITEAADFLRSTGAPPETIDAVTGALDAAQQSRGTALGALALGLVTSLYGASGAFGAVGRALNAIWRVDEGRSFVKHKLHDLGWTLVVLALVLVTCVLIFLGGALSGFVFDQVGLGSTTAEVWRFARWPAALLAMILIYAVVYFAAPNVEIRRFRWITPGALFGVALWLLASAAFFFYVSNFGSYSATYGAFAAAVILLVWLWLTNVVLLFGAELNAVIDLRRSPHLPAGYDGPPLPAKEPAS